MTPVTNLVIALQRLGRPFALLPGGEVLLEHGRLGAVHHALHARPGGPPVAPQESLGGPHGLPPLLLRRAPPDPSEDPARRTRVQDEAVLQRF